MTKGKPEHLHGALDLLILRSLAVQAMHGWAIARHIQQTSEGILEVNQGSLYPALYRLEARGWIRADWGVSPRGRRARIYALTPRGREELDREASHWEAFALGVNRVLGTV